MNFLLSELNSKVCCKNNIITKKFNQNLEFFSKFRYYWSIFELSKISFIVAASNSLKIMPGSLENSILSLKFVQSF